VSAIGRSVEEKQGKLTLVSKDFNLGFMGDKSPKATHKHAVQKQAKVNQKKSAKQAPKAKK
jgi:hypothetical protein